MADKRMEAADILDRAGRPGVPGIVDANLQPTEMHHYVVEHPV